MVDPMMYDLLTDNEKREKLVELLGDVLGPSRSHNHNSSQIAFDCPQCSYDKGVERDGKDNLEINYKKGQFNCWACGEETGMHGTIKKLMERWSDPGNLKAFKDLRIRFSYEKDGEEYVVTPKAELTLPQEYISLTMAPDLGNFQPYFKYLRQRRITPEMIQRFNIGCCLEGFYGGRIVIPSYNENGELDYFVTRTIHKWVRKNKYRNSDGKKEEIIFNERFIDWSKIVFIVEGPFDHMVLPNSIPLLGKKLSDLHFSKLYNNAEANIVLVLDPDAWDRVKLIYNKLDGGVLMGRILAVKMPKDEKGKDVDVSKFNELYGQQALFEYVKKNMIKLLD